MRLSKMNTAMGGYISEDGKIKVRKFNQLHALPCWAVEEKGKENKYFKTLKEAKQYINKKQGE